jgi:hypothetical protein
MYQIKTLQKNDNKILKELTKKNLIYKILEITQDSLAERQYEIMVEVLINNKTFGELETMQLTRSRQKQIFDNGIMRVNKALGSMNLNSRAFLALPEKLRETGHAEAEEKKKNLSTKAKQALACTIYELPISTRAKVICNFHKIITVADLVSYNPLDLLKLRNCGNKTVIELEDFILKQGLKWNMEI